MTECLVEITLRRVRGGSFVEVGGAASNVIEGTLYAYGATYEDQDLLFLDTDDGGEAQVSRWGSGDSMAHVDGYAICIEQLSPKLAAAIFEAASAADVDIVIGQDVKVVTTRAKPRAELVVGIESTACVTADDLERELRDASHSAE